MKLFYEGKFERPKFQTNGSAGIDLFNNGEPQLINPHYTSGIINTGVSVEIPKGYVGLIFPRSSLGFKYECTLVNSVGVIDSDYRGEIKARIVNLSNKEFILEEGERFCQLVVVPCLTDITYVDSKEELEKSDRGELGFGSTGYK